MPVELIWVGAILAAGIITLLYAVTAEIRD